MFQRCGRVGERVGIIFGDGQMRGVWIEIRAGEGGDDAIGFGARASGGLRQGSAAESDRYRGADDE